MFDISVNYTRPNRNWQANKYPKTAIGLFEAVSNSTPAKKIKNNQANKKQEPYQLVPILLGFTKAFPCTKVKTKYKHEAQVGNNKSPPEFSSMPIKILY